MAVEIRRVTPVDGRVTVNSVRVDGVDLARTAKRVAGGGEAIARIELTCGRIEGSGPAPPQTTAWVPIKLEVTVRTPIGLERTRTTRKVELPIACFA
jgi:hypothetical protein